jgi:beta-amylase
MILLCRCLLLMLLACALPSRAIAARVSAMAPLLIGDPHNLNSAESEAAWDAFRAQLREARTMGIESISVDVWWGLVQREGPQSFDWSYYHKMARVIREAGLKWSPILSTHACGTNVGDTVHIPLPDWVWQKRKNGHLLNFISESGHANLDSVSVWGTDAVLEDYRRFWRGFRDSFERDAELVDSVSISLGPSGELHYPSYHHHDSMLTESHYPNRGTFQGAGPLATDDWRAHLRRRFADTGALNRSLGTHYRSFEDVGMPFRDTAHLNELMNNGWHETRLGGEFFGWYHESLTRHMHLTMEAAIGVFHTESAVMRKPFNVKIPGIHWEDRRYAELMNGLLDARHHSDWREARSGLGYRPLFDSLASLQDEHRDIPFSFYNTAGATPDMARTDWRPLSRGNSIVEAMSRLARERRLSVKLENATASDLNNGDRVSLLTRNLTELGYSGVTMLRVNDATGSAAVRAACPQWLQGLLAVPH